jgi:glycosyltransferase involved in cell wall biosynthesis
LERVVLNLARGLDRNRWRVLVICLQGSGPFAIELEQLGIKVIALNGQPGMSWSLVRRLTNVLRQEKVDLIHTHNPAPHFHGLLAALLAGVRVRVHTKHGRNYPNDRKKVLLNRVLSWFTDIIVPVGDAAGQVALKVEKVNPQKVRRIWNGIDTRQYVPRETTDHGLQTADCRQQTTDQDSGLKSQPSASASFPLGLQSSVFSLQSSAPVIGTVARLSPEKDQKTMLQAFKLVLDGWQSSVLSLQSSVTEHCKLTTDHSPRLVVIGDGPCMSELRNEANRLGIAGQVDFLGMRSDIPSLLPHFSLFTLSSVTEGISMTILEAMACGVPIVATDVGGNREVVQPPCCGLIVPARDPQALAGAYLELLRDPDRRAKMGAAARQRVVEHFSLEKMCMDYRQLYEELLQQKDRPPSLSARSVSRW